MSDKERIVIAESIIANGQDYIELVKVQKKLKVESVAEQIKNTANTMKKHSDILNDEVAE